MKRKSSPYLTAREVAQLLRVHPTTLYRQVAEGNLHPIKIGHSWRFERSEMEVLIAGAAPPTPRRPRPHLKKAG